MAEELTPIKQRPAQIDWTKSMQQSFEYYIVNPRTWEDEKRLDTVTKSTISRDSEADTLGSASIDINESVGECYIRVYLIAIQNGLKDKRPLGTFLVQTPSSTFNGKVRNVVMDAYTPLIELKESCPPIGYYIAEQDNVMEHVTRLTKEHLRAPVVVATNKKTLYSDFVADPNDTWLSYLSALMVNAKYTYDIDELGRILFAPRQDISAMQPVWTYTDDNSSILYPEITMDHDLYGIPNVVEVIYSKGKEYFYTRVVNDDENSPTSTVRRGREIVHRVTDPDLIGDPTENQINLYAEQLLKEASAIEYTISYTHGYCPVRVGDCVMLNYKRAGITNAKAKVISQNIKCVPGVPVTEKAVFTTNLWR